MRKLSAKQKKILDKEIEKNTSIFMLDQISATAMDQLICANNYETLYQDAERYIGDAVLQARLNSGKW